MENNYNVDIAGATIFDDINVYDSVVVAKYLRALGFTKGQDLNVTKVQKLLFIAYGFILSSSDYSFIDEKPKAWPYGPVFPKTRKKVNYDLLIDIDDAELVRVKSMFKNLNCQS